MSGLDPEQLDEIEERIAALLEKPWDSGTGRPRELTLREAIIVSSGYTRQNIIEDVWAEIFDTSQPTISRVITEITPSYRAGHRRLPPHSRGRQGRRPRPVCPGRRLPGTVLVVAQHTGPVVRKT